jgi:integrase
MAYIKKLSTGNFQVQIRLKGLKPIYKTFSTQTLAKQFARQVEGDTELQRKLGTPTAQMLLFSEAVVQYLSSTHLRDQSAPSRIAYWKDLLGDKPVNAIDEYMVDEALHDLAKTRSGSTVNRYKSHLSAIFTFLIRDPRYKRMGLKNPVLADSVSRFKENPAKDRFLSMSEQQQLLNACHQSRWERLYLLVVMALTTGARKGELLGLKWADINFRDRVALVEITKTGKPRHLPLTVNVIEELMRFRESDEFLVFKNTVSSVRAYDPSKAWGNALSRSGIEKCRFHDLRHTAASNLVRAGRSLFEVGTLLGHSNPQMTQRYAHLAINDTLEMVDSVMGNLK